MGYVGFTTIGTFHTKCNGSTRGEVRTDEFMYKIYFQSNDWTHCRTHFNLDQSGGPPDIASPVSHCPHHISSVNCILNSLLFLNDLFHRKFQGSPETSVSTRPLSWLTLSTALYSLQAKGGMSESLCWRDIFVTLTMTLTGCEV